MLPARFLFSSHNGTSFYYSYLNFHKGRIRATQYSKGHRRQGNHQLSCLSKCYLMDLLITQVSENDKESQRLLAGIFKWLDTLKENCDSLKENAKNEKLRSDIVEYMK